MKRAVFTLLGISLLGLTDCQTLDGLKQDLGSITPPSLISTEGQVDKRADALVEDADCPVIEAVEELRTVNDFTTPQTPSPGSLIANAYIAGIDHSCTVDDKSVTVDLRLGFEGRLGPQAAAAGAAPYLVHPFFVAITDPGGDIMAKEIFNTTMNYTGGQSVQTDTETLRQIIPVTDRSRAKKYKVLIGFQLNKDQLEYNRAVIRERRAAEKAAAEARAAAEAAAQKAAKAAPVQAVQPAAPAASTMTTSTTTTTTTTAPAQDWSAPSSGTTARRSGSGGTITIPAFKSQPVPLTPPTPPAEKSEPAPAQQ